MSAPLSAWFKPPATSRPAEVTPTSRPAVPEATTRPTTTSGPAVPNSLTPTTQASDKSDPADRYRALIRQLGAAEYKKREQAQAELNHIGEPAVPVLCEFVGDPDREIADRVFALIRRPRDVGIRVEVAARLLETGKPDWMERGGYMLFQTPTEDYEPFLKRTSDARGLPRAIFTPVADQLRNWRDATLRFEKRQAELQEAGKTEQALKEREMHEGSMYYEAEAAYWMALDASEEYSTVDASEPKPASKPPQSPSESTPDDDQ